MINRLKQYIDYKGIKMAVFERQLDVSNSWFGKSLKTKASIGSDKIELILRKYSDINPLWLLTGEGTMLKDEPTAEPLNRTDAMVELLKSQLADKEKTIAELIRQNAKLEFRIETLENQLKKPE